ncbi:MAG: hypothetical protein FWE72_00695 [Spirochaetaceae bacterium]|nr:hypothetical protein [Spirochaetaceae bacterium]
MDNIKSNLVKADMQKLNKLGELAGQDKDLYYWIETEIRKIPELSGLAEGSWVENGSLWDIMYVSIRRTNIDSYFIMDGERYVGFIAGVIATNLDSRQYVRNIKTFQLEKGSKGSDVRYEDILEKVKEYIADYYLVCWSSMISNLDAVNAYKTFTKRNKGKIEETMEGIRFEIMRGYKWIAGKGWEQENE